MSVKSPNERILFGLKVRQLRQKQGLSFAELSAESGMSVSYLNEIEKGKKYPKEDKLAQLAHALGQPLQDFTRQELDKSLAPVEELLQSNFLNELPLDVFGIEINKVVELIASAPTRVGAFISTLLELSRSYAVREENFYFGALRSYLELNNNYFEDIEEAVRRCSEEFDLSPQRPLAPQQLQSLLETRFGYTIHNEGLDAHAELSELRAVYLPQKKQLLLSSRLTAMQRAFQFGKELAFQYMALKERAHTSSLLRGKVFEEVLNHSRATYFSVALHLPLDPFLADMNRFFSLTHWNPEAFLEIMRKYEASPEMFFHRLTNVIPRFFHIPKLFFLRFLHEHEADEYEIDKELHLNRRHHPHGNGLFEHYCRRWVSLSLLADLHQIQREGKFVSTIVGAQRSRYIGTDDEYLCITLARPGYPSPRHNVSVTLGLLINDDVRRQVRFLDDPAIQAREVNKTCERCALTDCAERAAPPLVITKKEKYRQIIQKLDELDQA